MTLTTHAAVGALVAAALYHYMPTDAGLAIGLAGALLSHPLLDAIPHWDYSLGAGDFDNEHPLNNDINVHSKKFIIDLIKISFDFWLGIAIVCILFLARTVCCAYDCARRCSAWYCARSAAVCLLENAEQAY